MPAAVESVFDLAFWLCDRALNDNEYIQPIKLQYLLFLCQAYYAATNSGRKLVPAIFVAEEVGPIEPSLLKAWTNGRPKFESKPVISEDVAKFADEVWRRFGHHSAEHLARLLLKMPAYLSARKRGRRAEIRLEEVIEGLNQGSNTPKVDQVIKPKVMRSHKGEPVKVQAWSPKTVKSE